MKKGLVDKIALAHHQSDQAETVILNIIRGAGLTGAKGMEPIRDNVYIRPLLETPRTEIMSYLDEHGLEYVDDETNKDNSFSRNYIRNEVSPKVLEKFPNAEQSVKRLSEIAKEEDEFLDSLASDLVKKDGDFYCLPCNAPAVLVKRASLKILSFLGANKDYESVNLNDIVKLLTLKNGSSIALPKGIVAVKEYDFIKFYIEKKESEFLALPFEVKDYDFKGNTIKITSEKIENALTFDRDKVPFGAVVRTRREGDTFKKFGGGTKKLKDYLIDKKIPRFTRDDLLVLAVDSKVLLIFGVEISEDIKVDNSTKNVLYTSVTKK